MNGTVSKEGKFTYSLTVQNADGSAKVGLYNEGDKGRVGSRFIPCAVDSLSHTVFDRRYMVSTRNNSSAPATKQLCHVICRDSTFKLHGYWAAILEVHGSVSIDMYQVAHISFPLIICHRPAAAGGIAAVSEAIIGPVTSTICPQSLGEPSILGTFTAAMHPAGTGCTISYTQPLSVTSNPYLDDYTRISLVFTEFKAASEFDSNKNKVRLDVVDI